MRLFELSPNNPVDQELARTAQGATTAGSLAQGDIDPMGGPENQPDPAMDQVADEPLEPEVPDEPIDPEIMSKMQGHVYMQRYNHDNEKHPSHPANIMTLDMAGLSQLQNQILAMTSRNAIDTTSGNYDDEKTRTMNELLSFVKQVISHTKGAAKDSKKSKSNKPKVRQQAESKTKAGKTFKAKRS